PVLPFARLSNRKNYGIEYEKNEYVRADDLHGLQSALTELCDALVNHITEIKLGEQNEESVGLLEESRSKLLKYNPGHLSTDGISALSTFELGEDIAVTAFNPATKTIMLARDASNQLLSYLINSLLSPDTVDPYPSLQIRIVGGQDNVACREKLIAIVSVIQDIDSDRHHINIASCDVNEKPHPHSLKVVTVNGKVSALD
ncbi:MAG: hypothetical protein V4568_03640, partial [Pseudomonadota bacterium]